MILSETLDQFMVRWTNGEEELGRQGNGVDLYLCIGLACRTSKAVEVQ
jgi:hypothetical protein